MNQKVGDNFPFIEDSIGHYDTSHTDRYGFNQFILFYSWFQNIFNFFDNF